MKKEVLKRLEILENDEVIEIEDLYENYRDIFGEEKKKKKKYEETAKYTE